jgi:hypothetical protein
VRRLLGEVVGFAADEVIGHDGAQLGDLNGVAGTPAWRSSVTERSSGTGAHRLKYASEAADTAVNGLTVCRRSPGRCSNVRPHADTIYGCP